MKLSYTDERKCVHEGAPWAVEHGFGESSDLEFIKEGGQLDEAEPSNITDRALEHGKGQLGSLGSGNHFLEVQVVDEIFHETAADVMGLFKGQSVTVMIHCGSRGLPLPGVRRLLESPAKCEDEVRDSPPEHQAGRTPLCGHPKDGIPVVDAMRGELRVWVFSRPFIVLPLKTTRVSYL